MKKILFILMTAVISSVVTGCADDSNSSNNSNNGSNNTENSGTTINCNETNDYQISTYGDVIKACLPADFPTILSSEEVYYKVSTNTSGNKVLNITFNNILTNSRDELKNTYETYYGHLTNIGTDYSIWSGCNENSSIRYEDMYAGIAVEFEFGAECINSNPTGAVDTSNDPTNNSTWAETLAPQLPANYPVPVTNLTTFGLPGLYVVYSIDETKYNQAVNILKAYYDSNPEDTFTVSTNKITATHVSDTEPHTLTITYTNTPIMQIMNIKYEFN